MFALLRTSRSIAALTAFVLLTAAMAPLTPPCATEAEAPCEEQMDHGAMAKHETMPMDHAPSEAPGSSIACDSHLDGGDALLRDCCDGSRSRRSA